MIAEANQIALQASDLSFILGTKIPRGRCGDPLRRQHPDQDIPDGQVFAQPWPASPAEKARRIPDRIIYYQYRHDRARRTLRGIDEQVTKAQRAIDGHARRRSRSATAEVTLVAPTGVRTRAMQHAPLQGSASVQPDLAPTAQDLAQSEATQADAALASELIASGVTTQPVETVVAVLSAHREGASINAAAKASGINYRTAARIVRAVAEYRQRQLVAVG